MIEEGCTNLEIYNDLVYKYSTSRHTMSSLRVASQSGALLAYLEKG